MNRFMKAAVVTILIPILWMILLFVGLIVLMLPFVALVRPDLVQINGDKDTSDQRNKGNLPKTKTCGCENPPGLERGGCTCGLINNNTEKS